MKVTFEQLCELEEALTADRNRVVGIIGSIMPSRREQLYETDWELDEIIKAYSPLFEPMEEA